MSAGLRDKLEARKETAREQRGRETGTRGGSGREGDGEMGRLSPRQGWAWTWPDLGSCTAAGYH